MKSQCIFNWKCKVQRYLRDYHHVLVDFINETWNLTDNRKKIWLKLTLNPIDWCAPMTIPKPRSCIPIISANLPYWVLFNSNPPYSAGTWSPKQPRSHKWLSVFSSTVYVFAEKAKETVKNCSHMRIKEVKTYCICIISCWVIDFIEEFGNRINESANVFDLFII